MGRNVQQCGAYGPFCCLLGWIVPSHFSFFPSYRPALPPRPHTILQWHLRRPQMEDHQPHDGRPSPAEAKPCAREGGEAYHTSNDTFFSFFVVVFFVWTSLAFDTSSDHWTCHRGGREEESRRRRRKRKWTTDRGVPHHTGKRRRYAIHRGSDLSSTSSMVWSPASHHPFSRPPSSRTLPTPRPHGRRRRGGGGGGGYHHPSPLFPHHHPVLDGPRRYRGWRGAAARLSPVRSNPASCVSRVVVGHLSCGLRLATTTGGTTGK